jgi:hypothetical protein
MPGGNRSETQDAQRPAPPPAVAGVRSLSATLEHEDDQKNDQQNQ